MSKVVIAGDASGTGTFTISAPNGNTDRTLVLPDEAGTVLTSASGLIAENLTGSVPASAIGNNSITSAKLTGDAIPVGVGQTWQDVLSSRANNVTYTNTTGRPIAVYMSNGDAGGVTAMPYVDGLMLGRMAIYATGATVASFVVPAGSTYRVHCEGGNPTNWKELR